MASKAKGNLEVKNPELLKPLVFSKRPKVFKFITFLVSAGETRLLMIIIVL